MANRRAALQFKNAIADQNAASSDTHSLASSCVSELKGDCSQSDKQSSLGLKTSQLLKSLPLVRAQKKQPPRSLYLDIF